jgi:hypothetical protein
MLRRRPIRAIRAIVAIRAIRAIRAIVAALLVVLAAEARADAPGDYLGAREIAVGDSLRAGARGALATTLNPAGLALTRELVFEGSYGHRLTDSAHILSVSGCDSTVAVPGCFYYRYFSASPEIAGTESGARVHEGGAALGKALGRYVLVGIALKYFNFESSVVEGEDSSGLAFDAGAIVRATDMISVGLVGYHLLGTEASQYPMAVAAGLLVQPIPRLSLSLDGLWNLARAEGESTGRYGGGAEYMLSSSDNRSGYPVRLGAVHDVSASGTYLSAGVGFQVAKWGLDIGARQQIRNGDELVIQASVRVYGPRHVPHRGPGAGQQR